MMVADLEITTTHSPSLPPTTEPMETDPDLVVFQDGQDFLTTLTQTTSPADQANTLTHFVTQLQSESTQAFPPLLCSLLKTSPECLEILSVWSQARTNKSKVTNLDRLLLTSFTLILDQLQHRTDLSGMEGGDLSISSPVPVARAILNRHLSSLQFYLTTQATWVHPLVFELLRAINLTGQSLIKELVTSFNFKPTVLEKLLFPQVAKSTTTTDGGEPDNQPLEKCHASRVAYLNFCVSCLETTDELTRITFLSHHPLSFLVRGLHLDSYETLEIFFTAIVQLSQPSVRLTWSMLLSIIDLALLSKCLNLLKSCDAEDTDTPSLIAKFLEDICTYPGTGVCFKDGGWYSIAGQREKTKRPVNGLLFDFLLLLKPIESKIHQQLALGIMKASPALASLFWAHCHLSFDPRLSSRWLGNMTLLQKVIQLPVPDLEPPRGCENDVPQLSVITESILPRVFERTLQAKSLQSSSKLVRYFGSLSLVAALSKLGNVLDTIDNYISTIPTGERSNAWKKLRQEIGLEIKSRLADFRAVVSLHKLTEQSIDPLLSQVASRILQAYQQHAPEIVLQSGVGLDKLLPNNIHMSHPAVQARNLELILHLPDFKWWNQRVLTQSSPASRLLQIFVETPHVTLQKLTYQTLQKQLGSSILFQHDPNELPVWMSSVKLFSNSSKGIYQLFDTGLTLVMQSPYKYIDSIWACSNEVRPPTWLSDSEEGAVLQLPYSPMLLGFRDCLLNPTQYDLDPVMIPIFVKFVACLVVDLSLHSNSPESLVIYLKEFINLANSKSTPEDIVSILNSTYNHLSSLLGFSPFKSLPSASKKSELYFSKLNESQIDNVSAQIDASMNASDILLGHINLAARFPNSLEKVRGSLIQYFNAHPETSQMIITPHLLSSLESTNSMATLKSLKLPLNLLIAMAHPSTIGYPGLVAGIIDNGISSEASLLFVCRAILFKLQFGFIDKTCIPIQDNFLLLEEIINSFPQFCSNEVISSILHHPLVSYSFLNSEQTCLNSNSQFLSQVNIGLANLLLKFPKEAIPQYLITKVVVAVEQCAKNSSFYLALLTELLILLPNEELESLTHNFLSKSAEIFSNDHNLVLIIQGLISALTLRHNAIPGLSLNHLEVLVHIWKSTSSPYMDQLLLQVVELQIPYAKCFQLPTNQVTSSSGESIIIPKLHHIFQTIHHHLKRIDFTNTRLRIWSCLICSSSSIRNNFAEFILSSLPKMVSCKDPLMRSEMVFLITTYLGIYEYTNKNPIELQVASLFSTTLFTEFSPELVNLYSNPVIRLIVARSLTNLDCMGWDALINVLQRAPIAEQYITIEYLALTHVPAPLKDQLISLLVSRIDNWEKLPNTPPEDASTVKDMGMLLINLAESEQLPWSQATTKLFHLINNAVRLQNSTSLKQLLTVLSQPTKEVIMDDHIQTTIESILTTIANSDAELPLEFKVICIELIYQLFKLAPSTVCSMTNIERLISLYEAKYTTSDRRILVILMHYETIHKNSIRQVALVWGAARSRFSSWEMRDLVIKGTVVHESLQNIHPITMRTTIGSMPLSGLSFDPAHPLVNGPEFKEYPDCYDPAFLLPLIGQWLSFGSQLSIVKFTQKHLLGFLIVCLSSPDQQVRKTAYYLLDEVYILAQTSKFNEKAQLLTLLEVTKDIIENRAEYPQLPSVVTQFVAAAAPLMFQPNHPMYLMVNRFLVKHPIINTQFLPMFIDHFNSFSADSIVARPWLLRILAKGLRVHKDHALYSRSHVFSYLMSYYHNPAPGVRGPFEHQFPILEIFYHCSMNPLYSALLLTEHSTLDFLQEVCNDTWPSAPLISLRLGLHLVLSSNIASLNKHVPTWPQTLLTLAWTGISKPSDNPLAIVEAALRITSFLTHYSIAHGISITKEGSLPGSLFRAILNQAGELLKTVAIPPLFTPEDTDHPSDFVYNSYSSFSDLTAIPSELQSQQLYINSLQFGLELAGQLPGSPITFFTSRVLGLGHYATTPLPIVRQTLGWIAQLP